MHIGQLNYALHHVFGKLCYTFTNFWNICCIIIMIWYYQFSYTTLFYRFLWHRSILLQPEVASCVHHINKLLGAMLKGTCESSSRVKTCNWNDCHTPLKQIVDLVQHALNLWFVLCHYSSASAWNTSHQWVCYNGGGSLLYLVSRLATVHWDYSLSFSN